MNRILVAIDGSEPARRAAQFAADLARRLGGCELLLLNVQEPVEEMQTHGLAREAIHEHREKLAREASAGARATMEQSGVPFTFDWRFGDPAQIIAQTARDSGCSLIVMGTRGADPIENLLLGSVAYKTLHLATLPVTLIK